MNITNLKPASQLAGRLGVKALVYGPPGAGKTPIINTAPKPILLAIEPGLLSMKESNVPTFEAYTKEKIDEFFDWFFNSNENKNFDTLCIDSISQMAEVYLKYELANNKDGRKAYGEMSRKIMEKLDKLYFFPQKHLYLICKQDIIDINGGKYKRPYFPGQDLNVKVPHLFDEILHLGLHNVPEFAGGPVKAFCTLEQFDLLARDRSGKLNKFEPPDLSNIFKKAMI